MVDNQYPKENDHLLDCVRYLFTYANLTLALAPNEEIIEDELEEYLADPDGTGLPLWVN